ncbi:MAG: hypothetical protein ACK5WB_13280 [Phycisphaerales bacterium]|jgi:hypothetical protein|nr:hypothetical protein [Phycisphaeraceae bacterium]
MRQRARSIAAVAGVMLVVMMSAAAQARQSEPSAKPDGKPASTPAPSPAPTSSPTPSPATTPAPAPAPAASPAGTEPAALPAAEALLERFVAATGGRERHARLGARLSTGEVEVVGQIRGTVTIHQKAPGQMIVRTVLAQLGTIEQGTDGVRAWEKTATRPPRLLEGTELAAFRRQAAMHWAMEPGALYREMRTIGRSRLADRSLLDVRLIATDGSAMVASFDEQTGLLLATSWDVPRPDGQKIAVRVTYERYTAADGVMVPMRMTTLVDGRAISTMTLEKVEHPATMDDGMFTMPEDVRALLAPAMPGAAPAGAPAGGPGTGPAPGSTPK